MRDLSVQPVKAFEIPAKLLTQKKFWNLEEFYRQAMLATHWHAFLFWLEDVPVAAIVMYEDALVSAIAIQTVIVDKEHRTPELVAAVLQSGRQLMHRLARSKGFKWVLCGMRTPEKYLEMMGNPEGAEIIESVVREPVGGE